MTIRWSRIWLVIAIGAFNVVLADIANADCGEVTVAKGDVKIENSKSTKAITADKGAKVCQGDVIVAGPLSRAKVVMEDGNELNVSPDSRIAIEEYVYKPADNKKKVLLNVLYGKVRTATKEENMYGDKAADGQANSFQVKTKSAVAGVRGTDFLTSFDRKTSKSEIVTFKGRVEVGSLGANGAILNAVQVGAGQKTEALPGQPPAPPKSVPKIEMERVSKDTQADLAPAPKGPDSNSGNNNGNESNNISNPDAKNSDKSNNSGGSSAGGSSAADGPNGSASRGAPGPVAEGGPNVGGDKNAESRNRNPANSGSPSQGPGTPVPAPRAPASMIDAGDLARAPNQSPVLPNMPVVPVHAPPPIFNQVPTVSPVCDLCNRAIESGPGKVRITITIPQ